METKEQIFEPNWIGQLISKTESCFDLLDASLVKTSALFEVLEKDILQVVNKIESLYQASPGMVKWPVYMAHEEGVAVGTTPDAYTNDEKGTSAPAGKKEQGILGEIKKIGEISEIGENVIGIANYFKELPPVFKTLKKILSIGSKLSQGIQGAYTVAEGAAAGGEGLAAAAEITTGAVGLIEAESLLGPPGWVLAGLTVAGAGVLYTIKDDEHIRQRNKKSVADSNKALASFNMNEDNANAYVNERIDIDHWHRFKPIKNSAKENIKKYGADAYDAHFAIANPVIDGNRVRNATLPVGMKREEEPVTKYKTSYIDETANMRQRLMGAALTNGKTGFDKVAHEELTAASKYDQEHVQQHTKRVEMYKSAIKEEKTQILNLVNDGKLVPDHSGKYRREGGNFSRSNINSNANSRIININLNRPMIEHFTINVRDTKKALDDFKIKVEEVLLEVLNSANTI